MKKYLIPVTERKEPIYFAEQQLKIFWLPDEIKVEKDIQDILVNFSEAERHERMLNKNPKYILRNYVAQKAIEDEHFLGQIFEVLTHPYEEWPEFDE